MTNIREMLSLGESGTLEFKEKFSAEVIETAVAFANTRGGHLLIGVSDNGRTNRQSFGRSEERRVG